MEIEISQLEEKARQIRLSILDMVASSGSSHIGAAYSIVDILVALYFGILSIDSINPEWPERDRFFLSKGHGGAALYATLAQRAFFGTDELSAYAKNGTPLAGHIVRKSVPGIEITAGSLGHGLSMAVGTALALRHSNPASRTFVLVGDGECNEGSIWEAALVAAHFKLHKLVLIIDRNGQQSLGGVSEIMNTEPLSDKWRAFGWEVRECDGHNIENLLGVLQKSDAASGKPLVIIAKTIKGKGVSFMEENPLVWHYKTPKDNLFKQAEKELGRHA